MIKKRDLRIFAFIWAFVFSLIALYPLIDNGEFRSWALGISSIFVGIAILKPNILTSFYDFWTKIGEFIGGIISKLIMFILYFGLFTPVSIFLKILGKDLLGKKINKTELTYWINREEQPQSMKNQF